MTEREKEIAKIVAKGLIGRAYEGEEIGDDLAVEIDKSVEFVAKNSPEDLKVLKAPLK